MPIKKWPKHFPKKTREDYRSLVSEVDAMVDEICKYRQLNKDDFLDPSCKARPITAARSTLSVVFKDRFRAGVDSPLGFSMKEVADHLGFARSSLTIGDQRWLRDEGAQA